MPSKGRNRIHHHWRSRNRVAGTGSARGRDAGARRDSNRRAGWGRIESGACARLQSRAGNRISEPRMMQAPGAAFHSGFVSILGRPNAGKSTLLNALVGGKLAIVSEKPQTTRTAIEGVVNVDGAQIVFVDTPGIHKSTTLLNQRMMGTVRAAVEDRDVLLYLADAMAAFTQEDAQALDALKKVSPPPFRLLSKIDRLQ